MMRGLAFDLVILDIMMPGENGIDFARELKSAGEQSILMLTAKSDPDDRIQGLEVGVDDYLAKPFEPGVTSFKRASGVTSIADLPQKLSSSAVARPVCASVEPTRPNL